MLIDWIVAISIFIGGIALLPWLLRLAKPSGRKFGAIAAFGMVFADMFDPKAVQASEQVQKLKEAEDNEETEKQKKAL